ncbi:MAG TPA: hypothetical protein VGY48_20920 [Vicinamibacterales bacterium]|nr:hypothetical protein [Vicinamibacterales bacterium]
MEIACPSDCAWLASAREHPPAVSVRQQQHDVSRLVHFVRDFSQRQSQLFFLIGAFLRTYQAPELQPLLDEDVAEAAAALAATFETAGRGVIYEHRPASLSAERLMTELKPLLAEAGKGAGSSFERDAAVVLRRVTESVESVRADEPNERAFLSLVARVMRPDSTSPGQQNPENPGNPGHPGYLVNPAKPLSKLILP